MECQKNRIFGSMPGIHIKLAVHQLTKNRAFTALNIPDLTLTPFAQSRKAAVTNPVRVLRGTFFLAFALLFCGGLHAQDLLTKKLPDTILGRRTLTVRDPFDGNGVLRKLFPGKWYDLSERHTSKDQLISWVCPSCKSKNYPDVNGEDGDGPYQFPSPGGVATRLIKVFAYADSPGNQYKVVSFNHSDYDPDGNQLSRFRGGLLGLARFVRADSVWRLQVFQPAIRAYGSFSAAPTPDLLKIGDDQYAFMIGHVNGGAGGPFQHDAYLVAEVNGAYRQILSAQNSGRTGSDESPSNWTYTCSVMPGDRHAFLNIVIVSKGRYWADDTYGLPAALKGKVKEGSHGSFTITKVYYYSAKSGGYIQRIPAKVVLGD